MAPIARPDDVRRENLRRILEQLRMQGALSRTQLAADTQLSASTVTAITGSLIARGILVEMVDDSQLQGTVSPIAARRGRPPIALGLNPVAASLAVVTLSIDRISTVVINYAGNVVVETNATPDIAALDRDALIDEIERSLDVVKAKMPGRTRPFAHITVAVQGVTDAESTSILWSPTTQHRMIDLSTPLSQRFGVDVTVSNDSNMIAAALRQAHPDCFGQSFAAVMLSHGIGMGLFLKGELFMGAASSAAEFGHMCHEVGGALCRCGRRGCIEAYAGDYGIWRAATGRNPQDVPIGSLAPDSIVRLADAARAGDEKARAAFEKAGTAIGHGLRSLFALIDPVPIAFIGVGTRAFDLMEPQIRAGLGLRGVGLSHADTPLHCYDDAFELIRQGALLTALMHLDNTVFADGEFSLGNDRHAS
ncbi:MAG: ROK family transcriptional regulator [Ahrensia sp.]